MARKVPPRYTDWTEQMVDSAALAFMRDTGVIFEAIDGAPRTIDHVKPTSEGGLHTRGNWQLLTRQENHAKANYLQWQHNHCTQAPVSFVYSCVRD